MKILRLMIVFLAISTLGCAQFEAGRDRQRRADEAQARVDASHAALMESYTRR